MGWFKEMESEAWSEYAHRQIAEEAAEFAEYLQEKTRREFNDYVAKRIAEEKKKAVTRTA